MNEQKGTIYEEKNIGGGQYGVPLLILGVILLVACVPLIIFGAVQMGESWRPGAAMLGWRGNRIGDRNAHRWPRSFVWLESGQTQ